MATAFYGFNELLSVLLVETPKPPGSAAPRKFFLFFFFFPGSIGGLAQSAGHMANVSAIAECIWIDIVFLYFSLA